MTLSASLWQNSQDLAQACLENPFVRGLADGSLPRDRFAYYVGQDAFFLESFARAYAIAAAKAPDWDGYGQFLQMAQGVLGELQLHQSYATAWGVDLTNVKPGAATRRYVDFLLATAWAGEVGRTTAAMTPCMRLYAFLGDRLATEAQAEHAYSDWIRTYSSPEFVALAETLEQLTDRYGQDTTAVQDAYRYAMECERDFFQAAWDSDRA